LIEIIGKDRRRREYIVKNNDSITFPNDVYLISPNAATIGQDHAIINNEENNEVKLSGDDVKELYEQARTLGAYNVPKFTFIEGYALPINYFNLNNVDDLGNSKMIDAFIKRSLSISEMLNFLAKYKQIILLFLGLVCAAAMAAYFGFQNNTLLNEMAKGTTIITP